MTLAFADPAAALPYRDNPACATERLGWHFYCDPEPETEVEQTEVPPPVPEIPVPQAVQPAEPDNDDPRARIAAIGAELDRLKALAILEPTEANVRNYIAFQSLQLARAATFSDRWRRTIWQNPELDYSLRRPTGSVAKRAWLEARVSERARVLAHLGERYGVFYFFRGRDCLPCATGAEVVQAFARHHDLDLMAVSLDGVGLEAFPRFITDRGQAARLGIDPRYLPTFALYDSETSSVIPVGHGIIAADELASRIHALTTLRLGEDY